MSDNRARRRDRRPEVIAGRALDRVVAVQALGQGSGVLFSPRTVLTAYHVVERGAVEVSHPSGTMPVGCQVIWTDASLDAAVLFADSDVIGPERAEPLGRFRVGAVGTNSPLPECQIVGFPRNQRYGEGREDLEYDQYRASVLPMAGRMRNVLVCALDQPAADERGGHWGSPLAGLSGAPVFAGPVLLGVVTQVPQNRHHLRVEAVSLEAVRESMERSGSVRFFSQLEVVTEVHPKDELFEARYAKDLRSQYRKTEVFGLEDLGRGETRWDLDTAYLSLEAEAAPDREPEYRMHDGPASAQRVHHLLAERPRCLLRGQAGAGKTTLVWWLAAHAANGTLKEDLAELNGVVPFVVPLREVYARGGRFPAVSDLVSAGGAITDDPPEGWAGRVLEAGRALLLVDGLDEVPAQERERARRWLSGLLDRYPSTWCLATVRPDAVDRHWLASEGFDELTLLPMSDEDIRAFVASWHDAARLECVPEYGARRGLEEKERLTRLEQDLIHQLAQNNAVRDLARTPLLCAVICALHRRRRGLLPTNRWALYKASLAMLLGGRDAGRGVTGTDGITLDSDEQHTLIQRLAVWLVRTGQQQMTHDQAGRQLDSALADMEQFRAQDLTDRVLRFLLDRSGLLQERSDDAIQFIHRTFQDFLAAKEFHESGYILELLEHAENEAWRDVIVLAVGHATRADAHHLIGKLIEFGDATEDRDRKWYLQVLAAQCATGLRSVDAVLRERVRERVRALLPPQTEPEAIEIAGLGGWSVDLLPGPEALSEDAAGFTVRALTRIRTAQARGKLKEFSSHPSPSVRQQIAFGWQFQPVEEYAREVLAGVRPEHLYVNSGAQLAQLSHVGPVTSIVVTGPYAPEVLDAHLPTHDVEAMGFVDNRLLTNLGFLCGRDGLRHLSVLRCPGLRDLAALSGTGLHTLQLDVRSLSATQLGAVAALSDLRTLQLAGVPTDGWTVLPALAAVRVLEVMSDGGQWSDDLDGWTGLEELSVSGDGRDAAKTLRAASRLPRLKRLHLTIESLHHLTTLPPLVGVRSLRMERLRHYAHMTQLRRVFPNLRELDLELDMECTAPLDLTVLLDLPDVEVTVRGLVTKAPRILGAEALGTRFRNQSYLVQTIGAVLFPQPRPSTP